MTYLGRDFSSYQGELSDADAEGISFGYVKATQSGGDTAYQNPDAPQQVAMLRKHGVQVGFYHFLDPAASLLDQVHEFQLYVGALGGTKLPLALDSEVADNAGWPALASLMMQFAMNVEAWTTPVPNPKSLLYVNVSFYNALPGFPWGRDVWLANPGVPTPQKPCLVWQQAPRPVSSSDLKVIDPDVFMGTEEQWNAFVGGGTTPVAPVGPPLNAVPGPGGLEVSVIGLMQANGLYQGHPALNGVTVYAGVGNPTRWVKDFAPKTLPAGTPLAVALTDAAHVGANVVVEQL